MGESIQWRVIRSEDDTIPIQYVRDGRTNVALATPVKEATKAWQRKSLRQVQIEPAEPTIVWRVATNSPAARAGLQEGDAVKSINGVPIYSRTSVADYIEKNPRSELKLKLLRGTNVVEATLTPEIPLKPSDNKPRLGIVWSDGGRLKLVYPGPVEQVVDSVNALVSTIDALVSRKSDIKAQHLGGFVKIISVYYILFQSEEGWRLVLWFSVLLNVNLAMLNLLPIPVLDGGHIVLALVEAVRRKPVSAKLLHYIQTSCAVALIVYMLYIAFYDVQEVPWKRTRQEVPELIFAPKEPPK
jgi:regulator of sigma E protease